MLNYTEFRSYFEELKNICESKNWDNNTITALKNWLQFIICFYNPSSNVLDNSTLDEYIKLNFKKIKNAENIKVLKLKEIINNPDCLLYKMIQKINFNYPSIVLKFSKCGECFIFDENGEYFLSASGICCNDTKIEFVDELGKENTIHHELQHINQNYVYPSEFPFAYDMSKMLNEGEAEYHVHLIDIVPSSFSIETDDIYCIYYLVYVILMLVIPKDIRDSWNKIGIRNSNSDFFVEIFKNIFAIEKSRKSLSHIFALVTFIIASRNSNNTKEIFHKSVEKSLNHCSKIVETLNQTIVTTLESDRKKNLEYLQHHIKSVSERIKILQNPDLLQQKYLETISDEKEFIASEPKEKQEVLLQELQLYYTLEKFQSILKEEVKRGKESIQKYQNKKEQSPIEILGNDTYNQYLYYQFGIELNNAMQLLLNQTLTSTMLFEQLIEKVTSYLVENNDTRLAEKLSFIDEIKKRCSLDSREK